jgi:hypothetical protein
MERIQTTFTDSHSNAAHDDNGDGCLEETDDLAAKVSVMVFPHYPTRTTDSNVYCPTFAELLATTTATTTTIDEDDILLAVLVGSDHGTLRGSLAVQRPRRLALSTDKSCTVCIH